MTRARALVAAVVGSLLVGSLSVVSTVDAVAAPPEPGASAEPAAPAGGATPDDVVVLHTETGAAADSAALRTAIERLGATVRHTFDQQRTISLQLPDSVDPTADATVESLADLPGVTAVEPPVTRTFTSVPNDKDLPAQRSYLDAVAAPAAWDREHGSASVRIAIVDSGVDTTHPELRGKVVDSYNAVTRTRSVTDSIGHGTFVAGVAAAATDNGSGIAGAGYDSSILAVKVADKYGDISVDDEIAGIRWAADHGAKIINLSLSGPDSSTAELRAVQYAQSKGALVVAAAGNEGSTVRQYPAAYPGVVAVGATDVARGRRASFSSHGSWVTLAAPGVNLLSTTPLNSSEYFPGRSGYDRGDGTSFSSPLVAGAAALLVAKNPAMTADQVRNALVASAHGYAGADLGRGQVDFDLALDHVAPSSVPTLLPAVGTTGDVAFAALSTARTVSFRVDDGPWSAPTAVTGGTARFTFSSYGYANGTHRLSAADCTAYGECNTSSTSGVFLLTNQTPALQTPAPGDTVSGEFTATATGPGGGLRLRIDGREAGFAAAAPYTFTVNGSLFDNRAYEVTVQSCSADHTVCDGPTSTVSSVVFDSLKPRITGLSRAAISPNGDGSGDAATLAFTLDEAQDVTVQTRDAAGRTLREDPLGSLPAGAHTWVWTGRGADGGRLPDGTYRLDLVTTVTGTSGTRHGLAETAAVVDTRAPRILSVAGNRTRFFPVRDGYRDVFSPSASLPDGGLFTLTIKAASGRLVRTVQASRGPIARTALSWNGRSTAGKLVKAGTYRWTFTASDAAGNITRTGAYSTVVDSRRLRTRTVSLVRNAKVKVRGTARCATKASSSFRRGTHLLNRCKGGSGEVAYTSYSIKLPKALSYKRLAFAAYGRASRTSQLSASFRSTGGGLEVPKAVRVKASSTRWRTVAHVPAAGHVRRGKVAVALVLSTRYAGTNDFDARSVRLRVTLVKLG